MKLISVSDLAPFIALLHFFAMTVANHKPSFIKQARSHDLPDDEDRLDQMSDTKNCGKCNKLVKEDAKAIFCELCFIWHHTKCEDIYDDIYKLLSLGGDQVHWF